jgi:hypothetical protein
VQNEKAGIRFELSTLVENTFNYKENTELDRDFTSAQILPTVEIVSTGYKPRRVSAPRRMASLPKIKTIGFYD